MVAELAPAYLHSFQQRQAVTTNACTTFAEGLAVRIPNPEALQMILQGVDRVVAVGDDEIAEAMRQIFSATHNVVEGAGASTFAALMREREHMRDVVWASYSLAPTSTSRAICKSGGTHARADRVTRLCGAFSGDEELLNRVLVIRSRTR